MDWYENKGDTIQSEGNYCENVNQSPALHPQQLHEVKKKSLTELKRKAF